MRTNENKKVRNATVVIMDGQEFKSKFEAKCYLLLKNSGLKFTHEQEHCVLLEGFQNKNVMDWKWNKKNRSFDRKPMYKARMMTYTPDFAVYTKTGKVYVESKGNPNDTFPIKYKMFLKYLSELNDGLSYEYVIVKTIEQMNDVIKKIKEDMR